jgi:Flp pilus assembly pilin Flp
LDWTNLNILSDFLKDDRGQDLAECCLITAFVALVALGVYWRISGGMQNIWGAAHNSLAAGSSASGVAGDAAAKAGAGSH